MDARCLWDDKPVDEAGDTCNLACYRNLCLSFVHVTPYLRGEDAPPKTLHMQPWAEALLNTQEGNSED